MKKNKSKEIAEIANIKGTRDIFGQLLYLSVRKNIDLNIVFQYPPLPEPPCFLHPNGSLRETKKSPVIHFLEKIIVVLQMFVVRSSLKENSSAFASFGRHNLIKLLNLPTIA